MTTAVILRSQADEAMMKAIKAPAIEPDTGVGKDINKPWGAEWELYRDDALSVWEALLVPCAETSLHCHPGKTAVIVCHSGRVQVETLTGTMHLNEGDAVVLAPGVFHRTLAEQGAKIIEIESPPNRNDLVRASDKYGRGQGYA